MKMVCLVEYRQMMKVAQDVLVDGEHDPPFGRMWRNAHLSRTPHKALGAIFGVQGDNTLIPGRRALERKEFWETQ